MPRSSFYRLSKPPQEKFPGARTKPPRALSAEEQQKVLDILHEDRFVDKAPAQVYATLLDEGRYLCSVRTMYRILHANKEVRERRDQLKHPEYKKPELCANAPNQVWSWDITKLHGPAKWNYFYLYVIMDIYSRYAVGWMVAPRETAALAQMLIYQTCARQGIPQQQLTIHSDRGSPMTAKGLALLLADLGITKSHSRPRVSNDNAFSESHFKTLKSRPHFPEKFGSIEDARALCSHLLHWYNNEHYHSGIAYMTPSAVHYGRAQECNDNRQVILSSAFEQHPERFVKGHPKPLILPESAWINPPAPIILSDF